MLSHHNCIRNIAEVIVQNLKPVRCSFDLWQCAEEATSPSRANKEPWRVVLLRESYRSGENPAGGVRHSDGTGAQPAWLAPPRRRAHPRQPLLSPPTGDLHLFAAIGCNELIQVLHHWHLSLGDIAESRRHSTNFSYLLTDPLLFSRQSILGSFLVSFPLGIFDFSASLFVAENAPSKTTRVHSLAARMLVSIQSINATLLPVSVENFAKRMRWSVFEFRPLIRSTYSAASMNQPFDFVPVEVVFVEIFRGNFELAAWWPNQIPGCEEVLDESLCDSYLI